MAANTFASSDKRIIRTRESIYRALGTLMCTKQLSVITVTELADQAGINRKTFYTYYGSPVDVIDEYMDHISDTLSESMHELQSEMNVLSPNIIFMILEPLITDSPFNPVCLHPSNTELLYKKIMEALRSIILENLNSSDSSFHIEPRKRALAASFISGGIISVYDEWLSCPDRISLTDATDMLSALIVSGLSQFD